MGNLAIITDHVHSADPTDRDVRRPSVTSILAGIGNTKKASGITASSSLRWFPTVVADSGSITLAGGQSHFLRVFGIRSAQNLGNVL
jgi:hypothetical protein